MKAKFDPKLREAAKEFGEICRKYDCAGFVLFCSPTHSEFKTIIDPTWSVMKQESENCTRFLSEKDSFGSKEEQYFYTTATIHILTSTIEWTRQLNEFARDFVQRLSNDIRIAWKTWDKPDAVPGEIDWGSR